MHVTRRRLLIAGRTGLLGLSGIAFAAAARTLSNTSTSEAKRQRGKNKKDHLHQGTKKGNGKDIRLRTGSVLSESYISEEHGRLAVHMLLPFEDFSSEEQLAAAVAEAEELGLFILPEEPAAVEIIPAA